MKVYISIPITGYQIDAVREKADRIKAMLSRQGHTPVSPLDIYAGMNPAYEDHICYDLRAMLDCDAVLFCDGWQESLGCCIEHGTVRCYRDKGRKNFEVIYESSHDNTSPDHCGDL